jgi:ubiquitin-protein ligase
MAGGGVFYNRKVPSIYSTFLRDEFVDISRRKFDIPTKIFTTTFFNREGQKIVLTFARSKNIQIPSNFEVHPFPATISGKFLSNPLALTRASADPSQLNLLGNSQYGIEKFYILQELHILHKENHPHFRVYPIEEEYNIWRVLLLGPNDSPYQNRWWYLSISFSPGYPSYPPLILFVHSPYHYNISEQGTINLDLLDQNYNRNFKVYDLLLSILDLLKNP